jgi:hypothetical protein
MDYNLKPGQLVTFRDDLILNDKYDFLYILRGMLFVKGKTFVISELSDKYHITNSFYIEGSRYTFNTKMLVPYKFKYGK